MVSSGMAPQCGRFVEDAERKRQKKEKKREEERERD